MARFLEPPSDPDLGQVLDTALIEKIRHRISPRARRMSLRVDAAAGAIVLVRPRRVGSSLVLKFVAQQRRWIERQVAALPTAAPLCDGSLISMLGTDLTIRHSVAGRAGVRRDGETLMVSGAVEHLARRVRDWLKIEAKRELGAMVRDVAATLGRPARRVIFRDPKSRWGSCGPDGTISLSWRLVLAPVRVARYVVAHEVAHLKHMNHSLAFWRTVDMLVDDRKAARAWLRTNGAILHQFGRTLGGD